MDKSANIFDDKVDALVELGAKVRRYRHLVRSGCNVSKAAVLPINNAKSSERASTPAHI